MNKPVFILISILALSFPLLGQHNPIFGGGGNDGQDLAHHSQTQHNAIFGGGGDDGNHLAQISQPQHSAIFSGGADDGIARSYFGMARHSPIFTGGSGDGFEQAYHSLQQHSHIFQGGSDDGQAQALHASLQHNSIFQGGSDDGTDLFRADGLPEIFNPPFAVELLSFDAWAEGDWVQIQWLTASELNHDYFLVEKSQDLRQIEILDLVQGRGGPDRVQLYDLQDVAPFPGSSYYRLRSVDLNGEAEQSPWVEVLFAQDSRISSIVYPNPSTDWIRIGIKGAVDTRIRMDLFDLMGRHTGLQASIDPAQAQFETDMELSRLSAGIYLLQIVDGYGDNLGTHRIRVLR